jgi:hypothetical protein
MTEPQKISHQRCTWHAGRYAGKRFLRTKIRARAAAFTLVAARSMLTKQTGGTDYLDIPSRPQTEHVELADAVLIAALIGDGM